MMNIFFYSLPTDPKIYQKMIYSLKEMLHKISSRQTKFGPKLGEGKLVINPSYRCRVTCCFTKFDFLKLERIIGTT